MATMIQHGYQGWTNYSTWAVAQYAQGNYRAFTMIRTWRPKKKGYTAKTARALWGLVFPNGIPELKLPEAQRGPINWTEVAGHFNDLSR